MKSVLSLGLAAAIGLLCSAVTASAQNVRAGTLTCQGQGSVGLILGSNERLRCTYQPASGGPARGYTGRITRLGLDLGIRGKSIIVWGVLASSRELPGEALVGEFVGAAADASLGLGAGAHVLVGGTRKSIVLQPLSVKASVGVNVAAGVAGLRLTPN
jgi:hypothetical protein